MRAETERGAWGGIGAGLRPSTVLLAGAAATALAPALVRIAGVGEPAWALWGLSLVLVGAGLIHSGLQPWLTPLAVAAGGVYMLQAVSFLVGLGGTPLGAQVYQWLVIPKSLLLVVLALGARRQVARYRRWTLAAAAVLAAVKPVARELGLTPGPVAGWLDLAGAVVLAAAFVLLAIGLRHREDEWARQRLAEKGASLDDFDTAGGPRV